MKTHKLFYRVLTVVILCAMLLPWGSGSLGGTARAACPVTAENWHEVGTDSACAGGISDNSGSSWEASMAIAPDGTPYVAWEDDSSGDWEIYVRRWNGSNWVEVGTGSASAGGISDNSGSSGEPSMAIAPDGTPYVAWQDDSGGDTEIYVRRWNGSNWVEVGTGSASGGGISNNSGDSYDPSMAIAPDGTPYVAWSDWSSDAYEQIYMLRWNGSNWVEVGSGSASGGGITDDTYDSYDPAVAIAPDGMLYVAWTGHGGPGLYGILVQRWNGSSWEARAFLSTGAYPRAPSVAVAPDGTPYAAWSQGGGFQSFQICVRRWNGSNWVEVGTGSDSGGGISDNSGYSLSPSVAVAPDGTPYVAWDDASGGDWEIYVRRWGGALVKVYLPIILKSY